jgi:nucleoid DNA-binding protein
VKLISALREKAYLSKPEATTVVDLFVDNMTDALARGEDANQLPKSCRFSKQGRN